MTARLELEGYVVFQAENGEAAIELLDNQHIDLIISDIMKVTFPVQSMAADLVWQK